MARRCTGVPGRLTTELRMRPRADELARRAYELYERRCAIDGWDLDDWTDADGEQIQGRQPRDRGRS